MLTQQGWGGPQQCLRLCLGTEPRDKANIAKIQRFAECIIIPVHKASVYCQCYNQMHAVCVVMVIVYQALLLESSLWMRCKMCESESHISTNRTASERVGLAIGLWLDLAGIGCRQLACEPLRDLLALSCGLRPVQVANFLPPFGLQLREAPNQPLHVCIENVNKADGGVPISRFVTARGRRRRL